MKISTTDKDTTIIEFSKSELEGCRITYESLARDTVRSREVLLTIINETARISGHRTFKEGNTAMDILPDGEGGCVIILHTVKDSTEKSFGIFYCDGIDAVIDLSRAVGNETDKLTLYRYGDSYYLSVSGREAVINTCSEFLTLISEERTDGLRLEEAAERIGELKEIFGSRASEK